MVNDGVYAKIMQHTCRTMSCHFSHKASTYGYGGTTYCRGEATEQNSQHGNFRGKATERDKS